MSRKLKTPGEVTPAPACIDLSVDQPAINTEPEHVLPAPAIEPIDTRPLVEPAHTPAPSTRKAGVRAVLTKDGWLVG